jgi:hypothetical protein
MKASATNPATNQLPKGISEEQINLAIKKSGYPLQTKVALMLKRTFQIQEEWSFIDPNSGNARSIDILAERSLPVSQQLHPTMEISGKSELTFNLIIECKQSELPFIFFLNEEQITAPNFPSIAGLGKQTVAIHKEKTAHMIPIQKILNFNQYPFISNEAIFCTKFCKCERKGGDIILSGEESFNNIIYPLLKAVNHFHLLANQSFRVDYFHLHLILGIGVLDAPMIGVKTTQDSHQTSLIPWVRVVKHHADDNSTGSRGNVFAFDIVHKDFVNDYIQNHFLPFENQCFRQFLMYGKLLQKGSGTVNDIAELTHISI